MTKYNSILDISDILNDYSEEVQEVITEEAEKIANEGKDTLKQTSPKNSKNTRHKGKYAKGWRVKVVKGKGFVNATVYNATDYQLTHLLENEHLTRNGGKTKPIKHIEPVHDKCVENYEKSVERIIKNGG